jgi:hypothetical protein
VVIVERRTPEMSLEDKMYIMSDVIEERKFLIFNLFLYNKKIICKLRANGKCPLCNDNFKQPITTTCCERQACKGCNFVSYKFILKISKGYETHFRNQKGRCAFCNAFPKNNQFLYNNNKNMESGGYRQYKPYQSYGNNHPQHPPPVPTDIADILNNAKYYIIKSGNLDNIDLARKFSKWATTLPNQVNFHFFCIK